MAEVSVRIGDRDFRLTCDDGQENRLMVLAEEFSQRVTSVRANHQRLGENHVLVMAALAVLDEYDEAKLHWSNITPEGAAAEWAADQLDRASDRLAKALDAGA